MSHSNGQGAHTSRLTQVEMLSLPNDDQVVIGKVYIFCRDPPDNIIWVYHNSAVVRWNLHVGYSM